MNEQKFKSEMRRARVMQENDSDRSEYWAGYQRGLRRSYHGENFGTDEEHEKWLSLINGLDDGRKQRGQGYRDGLAFGEISSKTGRPSIGPLRDGLCISDEMWNALIKKAADRGIEPADARREAIQLWLSTK